MCGYEIDENRNTKVEKYCFNILALDEVDGDDGVNCVAAMTMIMLTVVYTFEWGECLGCFQEVLKLVNENNWSYKVLGEETLSHPFSVTFPIFVGESSIHLILHNPYTLIMHLLFPFSINNI
ncbi:hypothetical protein GQX74_001900 [Glossina fuscipes]|nr:hypothetical protein GQX74_001900 [Glossina fuscipes]